MRVQDPNYSIAEPEGVVPPHSDADVTVQFVPDYTREYEVTAYVEVQGCSERLPVVFRGRGLVGAPPVRGIHGCGPVWLGPALMTPECCSWCTGAFASGIILTFLPPAVPLSCRAPPQSSATTCWMWATPLSTPCTSECLGKEPGSPAQAARGGWQGGGLAEPG